MSVFKLLPLSLAIAAAPLYAEQQPEQVIVTGSYNPLAAEQMSSSVSVIDRAMIAQLNKTNLADLLQTVPGVLIERQGGPGGLAVASIRGGDSNYTVVMVDGVAVNDPTNTRGGAFDLGNIDVDSIERIEVVRGPQSAIYGADALAGVINIISLQPQKGNQQVLSAAGGDKGYKQAGISALGAGEQVDYSLQLRARDSGEPVKGSEAKNNELNTRVRWHLTDANSISASYRYFDGKRTSFPEQSGGPELATSPLLDHEDYTDKSVALGWLYKSSDLWSSNLQATQYQRKEDFTSPGIAPYTAIPANGANIDFKRQQISWINTLGTVGKFWTNIGLESRKEIGDSRGYLDVGFNMPTNFSMDRKTHSSFVDINAQCSNDLLVQVSVRNDDADKFGLQTTSKIGLRYQLTDDISVRTNSGSGYKLPSFSALGHPLVGNAKLKPEHVKSYDVGLAWQLADQLTTDIDYFHNDYRDPIDFDSEQFKNVNRDQIKTNGVEWQIQWRTLDNRLSVRTNATYTDIDVKDNVSIMTGRPQFRAGLALGWQLNERWQTNLDYQWTGNQFATSQYTGEASVHVLNAYPRLDANVYWLVSDAIKINFTAENLLDKEAHTAVGFPTQGLTLRAGLRWQIGQ